MSLGNHFGAIQIARRKKPEMTAKPARLINSNRILPGIVPENACPAVANHGETSNNNQIPDEPNKPSNIINNIFLTTATSFFFYYTVFCAYGKSRTSF